MCDINKKTKLKTVTVYKLCHKIGNKYYAYFSGMEISTGNVVNFKNTCDSHFLNRINKENSPIYNENMIGRTSGFKLKKDVEYLLEHIKKHNPFNCGKVILKIKLGGDIMKGSGKNIIMDDYLDSTITYAGTEIVEMQEV